MEVAPVAIEVWDTTTWRINWQLAPEATVTDHPERPIGAFVTPLANSIVTDVKSVFQIWDVTQPKAAARTLHLPKEQRFSGPWFSATVSPDGRRFAGGHASGFVVLWSSTRLK